MENQLLHKPALENSLVLSDQQKTRQLQYLEVAQKLGQPEIDLPLIKSCFGLKLSNLGIVKIDSPGINEIVEIISSWRILMGQMKDVSKEQLQIEAVYLINNYPDLTYHGNCNDLSTMVEFLFKGKLGIKLDFINFSPFFISQVIVAYLRVKKETMSKLNNELLSKNPVEAPVTMEERFSALKENIITCSKLSQDGFKVRLFNESVYNFLRKTKRMFFSDTLIREAKEYGQKKYAQHLAQKSRFFVEDKKQKDVLIRQYGIDFCLMDFFSKANAETIVNSITLSEFTNYIKQKK